MDFATSVLNGSSTVNQSICITNDPDIQKELKFYITKYFLIISRVIIKVNILNYFEVSAPLFNEL